MKWERRILFSAVKQRDCWDYFDNNLHWVGTVTAEPKKMFSAYSVGKHVSAENLPSFYQLKDAKKYIEKEYLLWVIKNS